VNVYTHNAQSGATLKSSQSKLEGMIVYSLKMRRLFLCFPVINVKTCQFKAWMKS